MSYASGRLSCDAGIGEQVELAPIGAMMARRPDSRKASRQAGFAPVRCNQGASKFRRSARSADFLSHGSPAPDFVRKPFNQQAFLLARFRGRLPPRDRTRSFGVDRTKGERIYMFQRSHLKIVLAAAAMLVSASAGAQDYPTKPITLIVPWPAGGSTDISMRAIAESASKVLG